MATIIISLLLLLLIILALRSIRKEESCSGGCSGCSKGCKSGQALYEAYQQGEKQQVRYRNLIAAVFAFAAFNRIEKGNRAAVAAYHSTGFPCFYSIVTA